MSTPVSERPDLPRDERMLALAGLMQALQQVRRIADTGQADGAILDAAVSSVFRIDADTTSGVYGGIAALRPGLLLLRGYFRNEGRDELLPRLALAVLQLERRFSRDAAARRYATASLRLRRRPNASARRIPTCWLRSAACMRRPSVSCARVCSCRAIRIISARPMSSPKSGRSCSPRCARRYCGDSWAAACGISSCDAGKWSPASTHCWVSAHIQASACMPDLRLP